MPRLSLAAGFVAATLFLASAHLLAVAQDGALSNRQLLTDFMHYVMIDQRQASLATGQMLLQRGLSPADWVNLIDDSGDAARFEEVVIRAQRQGDVEKIASDIARMVHRGRLERVRNPDEIIRHIEALKGMARGRIIATERLRAAGEYALPLLLQALLHPNDVELSGHARSVLIGMGPHAVGPLCAAIGGLDPSGQQKVADILGLIGYETALPYLVEVRDSTAADLVRAACTRAIQRITSAPVTASAADLYYQLAENYYQERPELTSFPGEDIQLVWNYDPRIGLFATPVLTEVYHEAMAMRLCEHRLSKWPQDASATLGLWVAANLKREIEQPEGYVNPMYPATRRDAHYYAVASGAEICQLVLARAIADRNTPLVRRGIAALEKTAGGSVLWEGATAGRPPLLDALQYPNRRVRYEAALALAKAQPTRSFMGAERVVPTLASATREATQMFAIVIASEVEAYQELRRILEGAGYTVLPHGRSLADVAGPMAEVPGVDLVLTSLPSESTQQLIDQAAGSPMLSATPILALVSQQGFIDLNRQYIGHDRVTIRQQGITREMILATVTDLVVRASGGPITASEARDYQQRSLSALRDLAVSGTTVFDVGDAAAPLIRAMGEVNPGMRLDVAEVLSRINQKRAQVALADAALAASGGERIALLEKVTGSAKRYGNLLDARHISRIVAMASARDGSNEEATAAAALMGALNLPNENLVPMILGR